MRRASPPVHSRMEAPSRELTSFRPAAGPIETKDREPGGSRPTVRRAARAKADIAALLDEPQRGRRASAQLYQAAMEGLGNGRRSHCQQGSLLSSKREFGGGKTNRPLHARLRLIMHNDNERAKGALLRAGYTEGQPRGLQDSAEGGHHPGGHRPHASPSGRLTIVRRAVRFPVARRPKILSPISKPKAVSFMTPPTRKFARSLP